MSRNPPEGVSVGLGDDENIFNWEILLVGPPDTLYEGGFFKALLEFPADFPNMPPKMTFKSEMWHPNGASASAADGAIVVPERRGVHLDPAPAWRGPAEPAGDGGRAVAPDPGRRVHLSVGHLHALGPERRLARQY
ncbi:hypothetical protein ON010_g2720 [Phytophthora cinnamomi]|nr:hypothetical protein ON010_g2720 [Phytophthora cinnamomi]